MPPHSNDRPPRLLVVAYPLQGHINPARHLARLLVRKTDACVTICTAVSAHRKLFGPPDGDIDLKARISYVPYSDGYDDGFDWKTHDVDDYKEKIMTLGSKTVSDVLCRLASADGRPVACVVYSMSMPWVSNIAREHGVPSALYWIQPASVFVAYYHYFHGQEAAIASVAHDAYAAVNIPGLPPSFRTRDMPSFLNITSQDDPYFFVVDTFRKLFDCLDEEERATTGGGRRHATVLINTFNDLEGDAINEMRTVYDVWPIGPVISLSDDGTEGQKSPSLFLSDDDKAYIKWLDEQPARSVVYVSFGSLSEMSLRQIEEIITGLKACGRQFLMVVRKTNKVNVGEDAVERLVAAATGMLVEWCDQVEVLSHVSVGCFVTHCGWNSTLETMLCGVPVVGVPQWSDQPTNAWIMERIGAGVRGAVDEEGVLGAEELQRCLGMAEEAWAAAQAWKGKARAAMAAGGSADTTVAAFVNEVVRAKQ